MSSSDSEDGGYYRNLMKNVGNVREQLLREENLLSTSVDSSHTDNISTDTGKKYTQTPAETSLDLIEDDGILDDIIAKNTKPTPRRGRRKKVTNAESTSGAYESGNTNITARATRARKRGDTTKNSETNVNMYLTANSTAKGVRSNKRCSRSKDADSTLLQEMLDTLTANVKHAGRARKRGRMSRSPASSSILPPVNNARGRGRGRAQAASRGRGVQPPRGQPNINFMSNIYPTYNIGNTEEYPDQSEDVELFKKQPETTDPASNSPIILEDLDDNEELSVKVTWQSSEIHKFLIRKYQKLTQIFDSFSKKENVSQDKLLFTYNNKILKADDTPDSIGYSIAKFIDGGIVSASVTTLVNKENKSSTGIHIKFQCQNSKKPLDIRIEKNDKLSLAMIKCAEHLELPLSKLKFEFDGDIVTGSCTPLDMDLESGDCIDVQILR